MLRLTMFTIAAALAPRPLEIDRVPNRNARVHHGPEFLQEHLDNRTRYIHQSITGRKSAPGLWTVIRESQTMKSYVAIPRKQWVNTVSGRTAPGMGACPVAIGSPDFCNWQLQEDGYTVRNRRAGTDAGRYDTLDKAQAQAAFMNGDRVTIAQ